MAIAAKPAVYTVNTAHAHCPDHLWLMDEGAGTTLTDQGKTGGKNLTFAATSGAGPDWTTDGTHGPILDFVGANVDRAGNDTISSLTGTHVVGVIVKGTAGTVQRTMVSLCDKDDFDRYVALVYQGDEDVEAISRFDAAAVTNTNTVDLTGSWDLVLMRFSDTTIDWSLNGSAWDTQAVTHTGLLATLDRFTLGYRETTSPGNPWDDPMCAAFWWKADKDPADLYAMFSGTSWDFLTTTTKYLKLLAEATAASAASVEGVVLNAARDTVIGEFTGQTFEASLEAGEAVLLVPVDDILPDGATLTTSDTPLVSAYNTTDGTVALVSCTVIEA